MLGVNLDWMELRDFLPPHADPRLRVRRWPPALSRRWNWRGWARRNCAGEQVFGPLMLRRDQG
jgi:segregation and condensation protein A